MLGAIVGDIVGSVYERNNIKTKAYAYFDEPLRDVLGRWNQFLPWAD